MATVIPVSNRLHKVLGQLAEITKPVNAPYGITQDNKKKQIL